MPALPSADTLSQALLAQQRLDGIHQVRPIEDFDATAVDFDQTPVDNRAAFLAAIDWCANTGGEVFIGAGLYGVDGDLPLKSYASFRGAGRDHSRVVQIASAYTDTFTSSDAPDESIAFCRFVDFAIYGGWTVDNAGWNEDKTSHTFAALRLIGSSDGPDDPIAFAREGVSYIADPYHIVQGMHIGDAPGHGLYTDGRGEMQIIGNRIDGCSLNGIRMLAVDSFLANNSVKRTGDSAVYLTGGNQRIVNEKYWFNGLARDAERVGAGLEIVGSAVANQQIRIATQDTWGPGLVIDGDAPDIIVQIDEPGGGRVEQQGFGWAGARTENRSCIRATGAMRHANIRGTVRGGGRVGVGNEPCLVDFQTSGSYGNTFHFMQEGAELNSTLIQASAGYANNKRHNLVTLNGKIVYGMVTAAELADPTHSINDPQGPSIAYTDDGAGVRSQAVLQEDGSWLTLSGDQDLSGYALTASLGALASLSTVDTAQIDDDAVTTAKLSATGTASSSTFLRGDGSWAAPAGGGGGDLLAANNLSDVASPAAALSNLGGAAALGADDNYVTDAEKVVLGNTSGTNTGDQDLSNFVTSIPVGAGADAVLNIQSMTQAEYDAITPVATTFYVITA